MDQSFKNAEGFIYLFSNCFLSERLQLGGLQKQYTNTLPFLLHHEIQHVSLMGKAGFLN